MPLKAKLPDAEEPLSEWLERRERSFTRRQRRRDVETWLPIHIPEHQGKPFGVGFLGDIHGDSPDCNTPLLRKDLKALASTAGAYGVHIGDATDNWVGRLVAKFADNDATQAQARKFVEYLLHGCGVNWLYWLGGNHDKWNEGLAILGLLAGHNFYLPFWEAKVELRCGRQSWRVHSAHDFRGHSDWNITHGPLKAAYKGAAADVYVCGHRHDWGVQSFEIAGQGRVVHTARARGYKWADEYATEKGFQSSQNGAGIMAIFDPRSTDPASRAMLVPGIQRGCEILSLMRGENGGRTRPNGSAKRNAGRGARDRKPDGRRRDAGRAR